MIHDQIHSLKEATSSEKEETLISVLMPTYNVEKYIEKAVRSIIEQNYSNFELIIVDDCSTDETYNILKKLAIEDNRIKLYRNEKKLKICKTLNKAFFYSSGKYILRMDGDDISEPNRITVLKDYLDNNNKIMIVGSQLISIDNTDKEIGRKRYPLMSKTIRKCNKFISSVPHFWMARRSVYEELKGYRDIPYAEDYDFLLRGELHDFNYANVPEYLYRCRIRIGNTSSANGLIQRKTSDFVRKQHKKEIKIGHESLDQKEYKRYIVSSDKQKLRHIKSANYLNNAITVDRHNIKSLIDIVLAMFESKYTAKYLLAAAISRILIYTERMV